MDDPAVLVVGLVACIACRCVSISSGATATTTVTTTAAVDVKDAADVPSSSSDEGETTTRRTTRRLSNPFGKKKQVDVDLSCIRITEVRGSGVPSEIKPPLHFSHNFNLGTIYLWRIVRRQGRPPLGRMSQRVVVISNKYFLLCKVSGAVHRMIPLEHITCLAIHTRIARKVETDWLIVQFSRDVGEPSLALQLSFSPDNPPECSTASMMSKIIASVREPRSYSSLAVHFVPPEVNIKSEQFGRVYGPFTKDDSYMGPAGKAAQINETITREELQEQDSTTSVNKSETENVVKTVFWGDPEPAVHVTSPFGKSAAAAAISLPNRGPNDVYKNTLKLRPGDVVRVKPRPNSKYEVGQVLQITKNGPLIAVGSSTGRIYSIIEPIETDGVYTILRPTPVFKLKDPNSEQMLLLKEGQKIKIRSLSQLHDTTWGLLYGSGWVCVEDKEGILNAKHQKGFTSEKETEQSTDPITPLYGLGPDSSYNADEVVPKTPKKGEDGRDQPVVVAVRIRPFLPHEGDVPCSMSVEDETTVRCQAEEFKFDHIIASPELLPISESEDGTIEKIIQNTLSATRNGYNSCILAYGASGSGKTHTILGSLQSEQSTETFGIVQLILRSICGPDNTSASTMSISCFELYAEKARDLLDVNDSVFSKKRVRLHPILGPYLEGVTTKKINLSGRGKEEVLEVICKAKEKRSTASTHGNQYSSRSHALIQLEVNSAKISIVDLAGSERARRYRDDSMHEASAINLSLTVLRKVIDSLTKSASNIPPYRESILTFLLSESLGGNSHTTLIATVAPSMNNVEDSLATLRYAAKARRITNKLSVPRVEDIVSSLRVGSPKVATALERDINLLEGEKAENSKQFGQTSSSDTNSQSSNTSEKQLPDNSDYYNRIENSLDKRIALQEVILEIRREERDKINRSRLTRKPLASPTPPQTPEMRTDYQQQADDEIVPPPETEAVAKLMRALSGRNRMLSPEAPRSESYSTIALSPSRQRSRGITSTVRSPSSRTSSIFALGANSPSSVEYQPSMSYLSLGDTSPHRYLDGNPPAYRSSPSPVRSPRSPKRSPLSDVSTYTEVTQPRSPSSEYPYLDPVTASVKPVESVVVDKINLVRRSCSPVVELPSERIFKRRGSGSPSVKSIAANRLLVNREPNHQEIRSVSVTSPPKDFTRSPDSKRVSRSVHFEDQLLVSSPPKALSMRQQAEDLRRRIQQIAAPPSVKTPHSQSQPPRQSQSLQISPALHPSLASVGYAHLPKRDTSQQQPMTSLISKRMYGSFNR